MKVCVWDLGHMTSMPMYGKKPFKNDLLMTEMAMTMKLGMQSWEGRHYQVC